MSLADLLLPELQNALAFDIAKGLEETSLSMKRLPGAPHTILLHPVPPQMPMYRQA